jgi:Flp pilus assembly protein TadD
MNQRVRVYIKKGQYDLAVADFNAAITINPRNAKVFFGRGEAYEKKGEYKLALKDYQKAAELEPDNAEYRKNADRLKEKL